MAAEQLLDLAQRLSRELTEVPPVRLWMLLRSQAPGCQANTRLSEERTRLSKVRAWGRQMVHCCSPWQLLMPWETCDPVCSFMTESCHHAMSVLSTAVPDEPWLCPS